MPKEPGWLERSLQTQRQWLLQPIVTILFLYCRTLLISFNTSRRYWRGLQPSNNSYLLIVGLTSIFAHV